MKKYTTLLFALVFSWTTQQVFAEKKGSKIGYEGFSGGMMLHVGYGRGNAYDVENGLGGVIAHEQMRGLSYGIGGTAKIHLGKHLRIGGEGYVSNLGYKKNDSFSSVGWGGLLVDCVWQLGKLAPFIGVTIGGGSVKNVTMQGEHGNDFVAEESVLFRKYPFMAIRPCVGLEYAISPKMRLLFSVDYLLNATSWAKDYVHGPKFFFGFIFYRLKESDK